MRRQGLDVSGFFYNPNIHPFKEYQRRVEALGELSEKEKFSVHIHRDYGLREFLRKVVFHEEKRCGLCYSMRLEATAEKAAEMGADAFTSTLLYSRYQDHGLIKKQGKKLAKKYGLSFCYHDFREGWQEGIDLSVKMGLYRQPYCGCIYSEQERYDNRWKKAMKKKLKKKAESPESPGGEV